jgi:hypothetical protein
MARAVLKSIAIAIAGVAALAAIAVSYFGLRAFARERLEVRTGTRHASLSRESCIECHAPIAAEWRQSFHFRTVGGPFWQRIRDKGYASMFEALRIPCMNCHAPANVLDVRDGPPVARNDAVDASIDCVSCHVSVRGILGPGRSAEAVHEVVRDQRFSNPTVTSTTLCARCHDEDCERTVTDWRRTQFARDGVTCLHCHMPEVEAPSVAGGPVRTRRRHTFVADKDGTMLRQALHASIVLNGDRTAAVRIVNDRVGHAFPASGMNQLVVKVSARGANGAVAEVERSFGSKEFIPGYLDFWPFRVVTKIPAGEGRDVTITLPSDHGEVSATFLYRDWFAITGQDRIIDRITQAY